MTLSPDGKTSSIKSFQREILNCRLSAGGGAGYRYSESLYEGRKWSGQGGGEAHATEREDSMSKGQVVQGIVVSLRG